MFKKPWFLAKNGPPNWPPLSRANFWDLSRAAAAGECFGVPGGGAQEPVSQSASSQSALMGEHV
eukprot:11212830-Lingulodinium_polyedra.AAC.1